MKRRKVLILGKLPPPYMGPAIATKILLSSALRDHFHLLHLDTRLNTSLDTLGKWSVRKTLRYIRIYLKLFWICVSKRPSLVLIPISQSSTGFLKDFIFILLCKMTGRKMVLQLRGSNFKNWLDSSSGWMKAIVRASMHWSHGMIVLGDKLKYIFRDYFHDDRIFVIPNGGNFLYPPAAKSDGLVHLLFLSNLFDAKGIRDVMDAVKLLKESGSTNFHLDVAGSWLDEATKKYCLEISERNNLPVTFYPPVSGDEKLKRFADSDVFIFTPREPEGHPWVIVEAMAASLPVIATDKGAITESVIDQENGFIVKDRNPVELAGRMKELVAGQELRASMGNKSFHLYQAKFTEEKMIENYIRCFTILIGSEGND